jgi:hypothetical protein
MTRYPAKNLAAPKHLLGDWSKRKGKGMGEGSNVRNERKKFQSDMLVRQS